MKKQQSMMQHDRNRTRNSNCTRQHGAKGRDAIWQQRSAPGRQIISKLLARIVGILQQGFTKLDELLEHVGKTWPMLSALAYLLGGNTATTKQEEREQLQPSSATMISHVDDTRKH